MNEKKMNVGFMLPDEIKIMLKRKLKDGWIMFTGEIDALYNIENNVYPPKTDLNKFYEIYLHPTFPYGGFALGKRTKELNEHMKFVPDLDETLMLIFHKKISEGDKKVSFLAQQIYRKPNVDIDSSIDKFIDENIP